MQLDNKYVFYHNPTYISLICYRYLLFKIKSILISKHALPKRTRSHLLPMTLQMHVLSIASGGVISRTCNFGVISRTFLKKVNFEILFLHINFCSRHFQRTCLKLLEPVVRTGLPLIIKKLEDFVWRVLWSTPQIMFQSLFLKSRQLCSH